MINSLVGWVGISHHTEMTAMKTCLSHLAWFSLLAVPLVADDFPVVTEVETLLGRLRAAGVRMEDLEIGRADLEDVFLEIMKADDTVVAAVGSS